MEKRIRIIWMLSLISALVVIGVQGYWLYNQYEYMLNNYSEEVAERILEAGDKEYKIRQENIKANYTVIFNKKISYLDGTDGKTDEKKSVAFGLVKSPGNELNYNSLDSILEQTKKAAEEALKPGYNDQNIQNFSSDSTDLNFKIDPSLPQEIIQQNINKAITNHYSPFKEELLDSLLHTELPGFSFSYTAQEDTTRLSHWKRLGNMFSPALQTVYVYSPFEDRGIVIHTDIPTEPLMNRMAIQLFLAFGLILLLIGCLIFQIRTIMKQKKISELKENFVNTMIHELKRPVQTLKTFVSFLGDKDLRADELLTDQVLEDSMFELDNLSVYLNKLKDMMRADNPETSLNQVKFNLRELTEKVIRLIHIPQGKDVEFSQYFDMENPVIEADPIHLANVLSNLIENAIKYSGEKVNIEIKAKQRGKELLLTVSDNGIGIPVIEHDKVFAKFYRGSNLPDNNIPGLGLGLSYVKLISEAHHGHVTLHSNIGQGTSVTLFIPQ